MSDSPPPSCRLLVCVGPRCDEDGRGSALLAVLRARLSTEPAISCVSRDCLRLCTREPVVRLESTGEAFANPDVEELVTLARSSVVAR